MAMMSGLVTCTLLLSLAQMRFRRPALVFFAVLLVAGAAGAVVAPPYLRGAAFVVKASGMQGTALTMAAWDTVPIAEREMTIPWRGGALRGRGYFPQVERGRPVLLVPGVHAAGIDEPRLVGFSREIAGAGHPVVTAQLDDLAHYMITTRTTDMIEDAALLRVGDGEPRRDRPDRDDRDQLRRRPVGRRRGTAVTARTGRLRDGLRRPRRSAADADVPLHRRPARRHGPPAARLRPGDRPARRRRSRGAAGPGRAAARGDPLVPRSLAPGDGRPDARGAGVRAGRKALAEGLESRRTPT